MSFYTSLSGLDAATSSMGVTSNNIANVATMGFKRSTTNFGDVYASSPLQKSSTTIGQGVTLEGVEQEFSQGDKATQSNTLDLAISGSGFFPLKSADGLQNIYTRNGAFMMDDQNNVVNSLGQHLMVASVDSAGNANLNDMNVLTIPPQTAGMSKQTSQIQMGLNLPSDAAVITKTFNPNDPSTYNEKTSMNVYDAAGNSYLATVYYAKTQNASSSDPNNRWQTYVYVGNQQVNSALQQATDTTGNLMYVNKYGQVKSASDFTSPQDIASLNSSLTQTTEKFYLDNLTTSQASQPASVSGGTTTGLGTGTSDGVNFANYLDMSKSSLLRQQGSSAVTYDLDPNVVGPASVTFGPASGRVTVNVPENNGQSPTATDVAAALNNNASFVSSYVAEASNTTASISNINFDGSTTNPFSSFSLDVGGQKFNLTTLSSSDTDLNSLANDLNTQLGAMDGLTPQQLTVTTDSATNPTKLIVHDAAQRDISSLSLSLSSTAVGQTGQLSVGTAPTYSDQVLKITALDPSINASALIDATTGISVSQNANQLQYDPNVTTPTAGYALLQQTPYTRANVQYTVNTASNNFNATIGSGTSQISIQATSPTDLVTALNQNSTFNSNYIASYNSANNQIEVEVKDPTNSSANSITNTLTIYQNNGDSTVPMTAINSPSKMTVTQGVAALQSDTMKSTDDLKNLFTINVDGSNTSESVGLYSLWKSLSTQPASVNKVFSGAQIAAELSNEINRAYGGEKPFNFGAMGSPTFSVQVMESNGTQLAALPIDLTNSGNMKREDLVAAVQAQINASPLYNGKITVSYDTASQQLNFTPTDSTSAVTLASTNQSLGLTTPVTQGVNQSFVGFVVTPAANALPYTPVNDQRYGVNVTYDSVKQDFVFASGTTGDTSSIAITDIRPGSLATQTTKGLGMTGDITKYTMATSPVDATRGLTSSAAVLSGNALSVNVSTNFSVTSTNNQFVVSVDGVTGTVTIPTGDSYTIDSLTAALQNGINNLMGPSKGGMTPASISGVTVKYDKTSNSLQFTTGTQGSSSYIKVSGDAQWGLTNLSTAYGTTSTWIKPVPATDASGATMYIDNTGKQTTSATGFTNVPEWSPVYLKEGELTFNTTGNLVSPSQGTKLSTVYLPNGKGALTLNINYSKSTQNATPFAVLTQGQDGAPEGGLVGVNIGGNGLIQASYSNGSTESLGKVVLVNFSNPAGLKQLGNTEWYASSQSGLAKYGEAGSAGYGTVQSGALENANVDLTTELVNLITEQRAFESNSKALQTDTQMTEKIIQIQ